MKQVIIFTLGSFVGCTPVMVFHFGILAAIPGAIALVIIVTVLTRDFVAERKRKRKLIEDCIRDIMNR